MGYYAFIATDMIIPADRVDAAYAALCALNDHNTIKSGGRYSTSSGPRPEHGAHPDAWFGWMRWDYPAHCPTLVDVLAEAGFVNAAVRADGSVDVGSYDDKLSDHEVFLRALLPHAVSFVDGCNPYFEVNGEDGAAWRVEYEDGRLVHYSQQKEWVLDS